MPLAASFPLHMSQNLEKAEDENFSQEREPDHKHLDYSGFTEK